MHLFLTCFTALDQEVHLFHYESSLGASYCSIMRHPLMAFLGGFTAWYLLFGEPCKYCLFGGLA